MSRFEATVNKIVIIALSFIPVLSGLGLILAGMRSKKKQWTIIGLAYIIVCCIVMSVDFVNICVIIWFVSIIHTVIIGKEYCMRLKVLKESKDILAEREREQEEKIYQELMGEGRKSKESRIEENVQTAVMDINSCGEAELGTVPGIGLILAKRIIDIRREQPFESVDEFYKRAGISDEKQKLMAKYLTCSECKVKDVQEEQLSKSESSSHTIGRRIDI